MSASCSHLWRHAVVQWSECILLELVVSQCAAGRHRFLHCKYGFCQHRHASFHVSSTDISLSEFYTAPSVQQLRLRTHRTTAAATCIRPTDTCCAYEMWFFIDKRTQFLRYMCMLNILRVIRVFNVVMAKNAAQRTSTSSDENSA